MSEKLARLSAPPPRQLISRILDEPELVLALQKLDARALGRLIDHVGLEDSGELVALATTQQLTRLFDDDLWRSHKAGEDEAFDPARFSLWLEVMLEAGEPFVASKLVELPEELVMLALHKQMLVIDLDALGLQMSAVDSDSKQLDKRLESTLSLEIDQYRVISLHHDGWDTLAAILLALDEREPDFLRRLLERSCHASAEYIEDNGGLYEVLSAADMLEADAAGDRQDRRARQGFVAPSQAAAFLKLARATPLSEIAAATMRDPITRADFREYEEPLVTSQIRNQEEAAKPLMELLAEAEVLPAARAPLQLEGSAATAETRYRRAVGELDPDRHAARMQELSYLSNLMVAGCDHDGQRFRIFDAAEAVLAICNLGAEYLLRARREYEAIVSEPADKLFRLGWHRLGNEVQLPSLKALKKARAGKGTAQDETRIERLQALAQACPIWIEGAQRRFIATEKLLASAKEYIDNG